MIWSRVRQVNTLRSLLRAYYPAALGTFGTDLTSRDTLAVFTVAPSPELGRRLSQLRTKPCCGVPVGRLGKELQVFLTLGADPVLSLLESGSVPEYSVKLLSAEPDRQPSRLEPHPPRPVVLVRIPHPPPLTARESLGPS